MRSVRHPVVGLAVAFALLGAMMAMPSAGQGAAPDEEPESVSIATGASSVDAPSPSPPADEPRAHARPILAPPLERPAGPPPRLDTERRPDEVVRKKGVKLELWVPQEPVTVGAWLPAVIRVTNTGRRTLVHHGSVRGDCSPPATTRLDIAPLFDGGVAQSGSAAKLKRLAGSDWPLRMGMLQEYPDEDYACLDIGITERLRPGTSFERALAIWPRYVSRDQPIPGGAASVIATYHFRRILPSGPDGAV